MADDPASESSVWLEALTQHLATFLVSDDDVAVFATVTWRDPFGRFDIVRARWVAGDPHSLTYCQRAFARLVEEWGRAAGHSRARIRRGEAVQGVVAWERHVSGAWHCHAVVRGIPATKVAACKELAFLRCGISRLFLLRGPGAIAYCLKYALKLPESWSLIGELCKSRPVSSGGLPDGGRATAAGRPEPGRTLGSGLTAQGSPGLDVCSHDSPQWGCSACFLRERASDAHERGHHRRRPDPTCAACRGRK